MVGTLTPSMSRYSQPAFSARRTTSDRRIARSARRSMPSLTIRRHVLTLILLAMASSAWVRLVRRNARTRVAWVVGSSLRHRERIFHRRIVILLASQSRVDAEIATAAVKVSQRRVGAAAGAADW